MYLDKTLGLVLWCRSMRHTSERCLSLGNEVVPWLSSELRDTETPEPAWSHLPHSAHTPLIQHRPVLVLWNYCSSPNSQWKLGFHFCSYSVSWITETLGFLKVQCLETVRDCGAPGGFRDLELCKIKSNQSQHRPVTSRFLPVEFKEWNSSHRKMGFRWQF